MKTSAPIESAGVLAPAPVFFLASLLVGAVLEWFIPTTLLSFPFATPLGLVFVAASVGLVVFAVVPLARAHTAFDARKPTTRLVTSGAFRISRNPTYLSLAVLQVGLGLAFHSVWLLITVLGAVAVTHWGVVLREERYLQEKFGEEYRVYAANVRRWL